LFKAVSSGADLGALASTVYFYLDKEQDFESFQAIGEAGAFQDAAVRAELVGWVGASSIMGATAKMLADTPTVGETVRQVQLAILEADKDDDEPAAGPLCPDCLKLNERRPAALCQEHAVSAT
jgi:hypothetical protein